jgi:arginine-tRNA-protein transferase
MIQNIFFDIEVPEFADSLWLDNYLEEGWFRSSRMMLRSNVLCVEGELLETINIRYNLRDYEYPKRLRKLMRRNHRLFRHEVRPARITKRRRCMYKEHIKRFKGMVVPTLDAFMAGSFHEYSPFNTMEVTVYDGRRIVAVSYFDVGMRAIASILGFFDPAYSRYSLGIYTMLLEIEWARQHQIQYYYPGYILDAHPLFDYKLRLGQAEVYDWNHHWFSFDPSIRKHTLASIIRSKHHLLSEQLERHAVLYDAFSYPLAYLGYLQIPLSGESVLFQSLNFVRDFAFFYLGVDKDENFWVVAYDPLKKLYHIAAVRYFQLNSLVEKAMYIHVEESPNTLLDILYYQEFYYLGEEAEQVALQAKQLQKELSLNFLKKP